MNRFLLILITSFICLGVFGCTEKDTKDETTAVLQTDNCSVHFLNCGKADSILIIADGECMLIDAGYIEKSNEVVDYLKAQGVKKLSYLVLTHGDKDHVGGMAAILENFEVDNMLLSPKDENSNEYNAMVTALEKLNLSASIPEVGSNYTLGKGNFTVLAPMEGALAEGSDNDASLVIRYEYGEKSFLLMGDALSTTEKEMRENGTALICDVLKVGHHGKDDASKKKFIKTVAPLYAVITCGEIEGDDEDGEPDDEVLNILSVYGAEILRTDEQGTIIFDTDGTQLTLRAKEN